jgi:hypothetical protein
MSEEVPLRSVPGTKWKNPTTSDVRFSLNVSGIRVTVGGRVIPAIVRDVVIKPGESVVIESEFDRAIQVVRGGQIQSGLAPQLRRMKGDEEVTMPLHPALTGAVSSPPSSFESTGREARVRAKRSAE